MRKELNGMFTEGQLVIYGGEGVCRIAAVGPSSLSGTDKTKLYYTLTPLTRSGTVLTPVISVISSVYVGLRINPLKV